MFKSKLFILVILLFSQSLKADMEGGAVIIPLTMGSAKIAGSAIGSATVYTGGALKFGAVAASIASNPITLTIGATVITGVIICKAFDISLFGKKISKSKNKSSSNSSSSSTKFPNRNNDDDEDDSEDEDNYSKLDDKHEIYKNRPPTNKEIAQEAAEQGFRPTNEYSLGEKVYTNGVVKICFDTTRHMGHFCWIVLKRVGKSLLPAKKVSRDFGRVIKHYKN